MNRFYCTNKRGQVTVSSNTTIIDTDVRVKNFFEPTPKGHKKKYTDVGLPFNELIPLPTEKELEDKAKEDYNNLIYQELNDLDKQSIRDIREWIATQVDAPQGLKDREAQAKDARSRLK